MSDCGDQFEHRAFFSCVKAKKMKAFFDEDDRDDLNVDGETTNDNFKTEVFNVLMEKLIEEINKRHLVVMEIDRNRKFGVLGRYNSITVESNE